MIRQQILSVKLKGIDRNEVHSISMNLNLDLGQGNPTIPVRPSLK